jgi:hypothetical protein
MKRKLFFVGILAVGLALGIALFAGCKNDSDCCDEYSYVNGTLYVNQCCWDDDLCCYL